MIPPIPQSASFCIPEMYTKDFINVHRLLLHDSEDLKFQTDQLKELGTTGRILIWSSDVQLQLLFDSSQVHMDGTFCTTPPQFDQVFIIQAIHHGTCKLFSFDDILLNDFSIFVNVFSIMIGVPVVYALLPDRKAITYVYLFNVLIDEAKKLHTKFEPSLIMTDFEGGLAKAISLEV